MAPYFTTKSPYQFPIEFREGFVKYWPIISLVLLALSIPGILALFTVGLGAAFSTLGFLPLIVVVFSMAVVLLRGFALPGLFNRKRQGWVLSYYAQLLSILGGVLSFNIVSIIIGTLLGLVFLAILFQVREYYN